MGEGLFPVGLQLLRGKLKPAADFLNTAASRLAFLLAGSSHLSGLFQARKSQLKGVCVCGISSLQRWQAQRDSSALSPLVVQAVLSIFRKLVSGKTESLVSKQGRLQDGPM